MGTTLILIWVNHWPEVVSVLEYALLYGASTDKLLPGPLSSSTGEPRVCARGEQKLEHSQRFLKNLRLVQRDVLHRDRINQTGRSVGRNKSFVEVITSSSYYQNTALPTATWDKSTTCYLYDDTLQL